MTFSLGKPELRPAWVALLLLLVFIVYLPGADGPFLLDDKPNIVNNPKLNISSLNPQELAEAATSMSEVFKGKNEWLNRPISYVSFALNYYFAESPSWAMKVTNIVIHLVCGMLVYCFAASLLNAYREIQDRSLDQKLDRFPLAAASLWVCHPLLVSTVLYSVQRMAQLSTLFVLSALIAFVHFRTQLYRRNDPLWPGMFAVGLFTALAFLSKENGILALLLCGVVEVYFFRGHWADAVSKYKKYLFRAVLIVPALIIFAYLGMRYLSPNANILDYRLFDTDERLMTQFRVLIDYLFWFVVPDLSNMGFLHDGYALSKSLFDPLSTLFAILFWLGVVVFCLFSAAKRFMPWLGFAMSFFLVAHVLESSVLNLELVFEHRNYLPYVGLAITGSWGLIKLSERLVAVNLLPKIMMFALCFLVPLALTAERVNHWQSEERLLIHWSEINTDSPRFWQKIADFYYQRGFANEAQDALDSGWKQARWEEGFGLAKLAITCIEGELEQSSAMRDLVVSTVESIKMRPSTAYSVNQFNYVISLCPINGQSSLLHPLYRAGAQSYHWAMKAKSHYALGVISAKQNKGEEAKQHFERALALDPSAISAIKDVGAEIPR